MPILNRASRLSWQRFAGLAFAPLRSPRLGVDRGGSIGRRYDLESSRRCRLCQTCEYSSSANRRSRLCGIDASHPVPKMTEGRAALVGLIQRYLAGLMDPFISLLEVHKLLYFMQEAGESSLRLRYAKAPYGPYAENLRHLLMSVEGYLTSGYTDGSDDPEKQLELVPGAVDDADQFLTGHPDTQRRFERVADLVEGFETPFGLELLSTVHWVSTREGAGTRQAVSATLEWNERKRRFSPQQITLAWNVLRDKGWLSSNSAAAA